MCTGEGDARILPTDHRITRSLTIPSKFFALLSTRERPIQLHFQQHFLPSSPMCECKRFPVHSSKLGLDVPRVKFAAVNHLCLACMYEEVFSRDYRTEPELNSVFWTDELHCEWQTYYESFYTDREIRILVAQFTRAEFISHLEAIMVCITPWLRKRRVQRTCTHAGSCGDYGCIRGTEPVPVSADGR